MLHALGRPGHGERAPATARSLPVILAMPAKPLLQLPGDPGDGETEAQREPAQPGGERGRLTSPGSALRGEEEQQTPEEEGEGTRAGKHRSPAIGARGLRSRCPAVSWSQCRGAAAARCPAAGPGARRCRGLVPGVGFLGAEAGARGCRFPGMPVPGVPRCRCPGMPVSGVPRRRCPGVSRCWCPAVAVPGVPRCRCPGVPVPGVPRCRCPAGLVSLRSKAPPLGRAEEFVCWY